MQFRKLVEASQRVAETSRRLEKIRLLSDLLRESAPEDVPIAVSYLSGYLRQGKIGIGYAAIRDAAVSAAAITEPLTLTEVDSAFYRIAASTGIGSSRLRKEQIRELLSRAAQPERDFLARLIVGELRQGSLEGIMVEALAIAAGIPVEKVRSAAMIAGDLGLVGRVSIEEGVAGLSRFQIRVLHPFQPMLAQTAEDVAEAMNALGTAALEYKMDGVRIQAHKQGREARIFTRNLNDVTEAVPDLVEILLGSSADQLVLDGEALSFGSGGKPRPFQISMRRFGRKLSIAEMKEKIPLTAFFFDCLLFNNEVLLNRKEEERFAVLQQVTAAEHQMPRILAHEKSEAERFMAAALAAGHEGIMAKDPAASYEPGIRSSRWLKVKLAHTLDLVVLAAEWGHGRRRGFLSNLHIGARDPGSGKFIMLGKTFKGLTDAMLEWQTKRLLELEIRRDSWTVYVHPELVVEVAFNNIQSSSQYPAGLALRFARVKAFRTDKGAEDADTIESVRLLADRAK
jgi:DNA ligase 1